MQALAIRQQERMIELEAIVSTLATQAGVPESSLSMSVPLGTVFELPLANLSLNVTGGSVTESAQTPPLHVTTTHPTSTTNATPVASNSNSNSNTTQQQQQQQQTQQQQYAQALHQHYDQQKQIHPISSKHHGTQLSRSDSISKTVSDSYFPLRHHPSSQVNNNEHEHMDGVLKYEDDVCDDFLIGHDSVGNDAIREGGLFASTDDGIFNDASMMMQD